MDTASLPTSPSIKYCAYNEPQLGGAVSWAVVEGAGGAQRNLGLVQS